MGCLLLRCILKLKKTDMLFIAASVLKRFILNNLFSKIFNWMKAKPKIIVSLLSYLLHSNLVN